MESRFPTHLKAREWQITLLNYIQKQVLTQCKRLKVQPNFVPHDWHEDVAMGMTMADADIKFKAFKSLRSAYNVQLCLLGMEQV